MATATELREDALRIAHQARAKLDEIKSNTDEARTSEIEAEFTRMMADHDKLVARANDLDKLDAFEAAINAADPRTRSEDRTIEARAGETAAEVEMRNFNHFLRTGEVRAQSVGTPANGGYLVPSAHSPELIKAMKAYGGILQVANVFSTDTGGNWNQPSLDNTSYTARIIAENTDGQTSNTLVFANKVLGSYTFTTDTILASNESLQDASYNLDQVIFDSMAEAFGRGLNAYGTVGTGTGQPEGVQYAVAQGSNIETAANNAIIADELFKTVHSLNSAYRSKAVWMMNDQTLLAVRLLKDQTSGAYVWQPGLQAGEPGTLLGHKYVINDDMPNVAAGNTPILFGDFSKYFVRFVKGFSVIRQVEKFAQANQTGFVGHARADAKLMDVKAIKGLKMKA